MTLRLRLTLLYGLCFLVAGAAVLAITYGLVAHDASSQTDTLYAHPVKVRLRPGSSSALLLGRPVTGIPGGSATASGKATPDGAGSAGRTERSGSPGPVQGIGKRQTLMAAQILPDGTEILTWRSESVAQAPIKDPPGKVPDLKRIAASLQEQVNGIVARANGALVSQRSRSLGSLLTWSGVALGVMALISILLGWLLAGRALRPLRAMTSRARQITEENLGERLSVGARQDELGDLANTFDGVLARLERAFDAQKQFVANASHELRTPLTLERALLEVALADPGADAAELRHACERVLASTQQQERTIEALLALARSQGGTDIDAPADLAELAQDAITLRERRLDDIAVAADLHPAPLKGDPALLERLVSNLIDNAIVHNRTEDAWMSVETGTEAGTSWLRVSNSGSEVPEWSITEIFEPFRRMDGERTATATGLGLGLSIVKAIADVHGAALQARPVDGGGLRVDVRFRAVHDRVGNAAG